jgi:DNA replication protein DnaC
MGRPARSSLDGELAANARRLFISGDVVRGFLDGATAAEVRAANRLLPAELKSRDVHRWERLMRRARFPQVKSFEGYDYSQVAFPDGYGPAELESLSFLDTAEGFVLHGRTGRGKTHLATSAGYPVRFHSTARLVMQLERARADGKLDGALRDATNADLVILDEFGYVLFDVDGARLL